MPIPRFIEQGVSYEIVLFCPNCGWAIPKDKVTQLWKQCHYCGGKVETKRIDYATNPYAYKR